MLLQQPVTQPTFVQETLTSINRPAEQPKPIQEYYTVPNDNLTKVASDRHTTPQRLFNKNLDIVDPDELKVGQRLVIPADDEVLTDRPFPTTIQSTLKATGQPQVKPSGFSASGNTYAKGYCTHYAKQMRPDLPNNLGNANTWASRARVQGFSVGTTPRAGAIGQQGNHVVYVTSVNPNGTFNLSEQNYKGLFVVSTRANVSPSGYQFIY